MADASTPGTRSATEATRDLSEELRRIPLFHGLPAEELSRLAARVSTERVGAGELVVREGDPGDALLLITRGGLRVVVGREADGKILNRLGPGEPLGEMALLTGEPRSATAVTEMETEFLRLAKKDFDELVRAQPGLREEVDRVVRRRESGEARFPYENEARTLLAIPPDAERISIGREAGNDVVLSHPTVSARHAELRRSNGRLELRDLNSASGTFHARRRVTGQVALEDGDDFQLGAERLFLSDGVLKQFVSSRGIRVEADKLGRTVASGREILREADLAVYPGELVALVGSSGAGKTTLLNMLLGLQPPTTGGVHYDSTELQANLDQFRPTLGYVPQDDIIHAELTVEQTLRYAAALRLPPDMSLDETDRRIAEVLRQVGLEGERDNRVQTLSGGQRKRASIAVELLAEPRVFFLDEPTSGLDPGLDEQIMLLLRNLADEGRTVVLTTHATRNINVCDRICVMTGGRIVFFGPPPEALSFFGAEDFVEIYRTLDEESATSLAERYERSDTYQRNVASRLITPRQEAAGGATAVPALPAAAPVQAGSRFLRQTAVLLRRNFSLMAADRATFWLRVLGSPLIAAGLLVVFDEDIFALRDDEGGVAALAASQLHIASAIILFLAATGAATEIVREASVFERERLVNLSPLAYVVAKVSALVGVSLLQSIFMVVVLALGMDLPGPQAETIALLFAAMFITSLAGMAMGLLVSSLSENQDQAITVAVILLIPQLIFAGAIVPLSEMSGVARVVADFMPSKWALELLAGITDLHPAVVEQSKFFTPTDNFEAEVPHPFKDAFDNPLVYRWLILGGFATAFMAATTMVQFRKGRH